MANEKLRAARKEKRWTIAVAAEKARISWLTYSRWEKGTQEPYLSSLDQLCDAFGKTPQELGFSQLVEEPATDSASNGTLLPMPTLVSQESPIITLTGNEAAALLSLLGDDMTQFDEAKRATLRTLLKTAGAVGITLAMPQNMVNLEPWERLAAAAKKPTNIDAATLEHFSRINLTCWELTNGTGIKAINQLLPAYLPYLPQLTTIAHQSSSHRSFAARLAAQGYLLTGLIALDEYNRCHPECCVIGLLNRLGSVRLHRKWDGVEMERSSRLAVQYSQLAGDYNLLAAAYKQQATMFLVAKKPEKSLQTYEKTLPFVGHVSPLLRSRIYHGLASASARCGQEGDALRYLGLARDTFPSDFLNDPSYLFADSGLSVFHMYEGLTYLDLNNPKEAWKAFAEVDGLSPKMQIGEFTRLEFLNLQAKTAVGMGSMELCELYLETSVTLATAIDSQFGNGEALEAYQAMQSRWPQEKRVKGLGELFYS